MKRTLQNLTIFSVFITCLALSNQPLSEKLQKTIEKDYTYLDAFYTDLHQNPELSLFEKETSRKLASALRDIGFEVTANFVCYGVVGVLENG